MFTIVSLTSNKTIICVQIISQVEYRQSSSVCLVFKKVPQVLLQFSNTFLEHIKWSQSDLKRKFFSGRQSYEPRYF